MAPHRVLRILLGSALVVACVKEDTGNDSTSGAVSISISSGPASVTSGPAGSTGLTGEVTSGDATLSTTFGDRSTGEVCTDPDCMCDPFGGDCPVGQKCVAYATGKSGWNATRCVDVTGSDGPGDPCTSQGLYTGIDSCIEGARCWDFEPNNGPQICVAVCVGSFEAVSCGPGTDLLTIGAGAGCLCLPSCNPLIQDCANPGDGCYPWNYPYLFCSPDLSGDGGKANDPCMHEDACDPGLTCAAADLAGAGCPEGSPGCCTPFCELPDGACPNMDQECVQYFAPRELRGDDWRLGLGVCTASQ